MITCSPYEKEIYSLYGHTAIRYKDLRCNQDWVFNYGVFNFKKPFFVARFALGHTDYELGVLPFALFIEEYKRQNRTVTEQVLNLTEEEKTSLFKALVINLEPQNREYRYDFFNNNCTTKARDMIESCIEGTVHYAHTSTPKTSYRSIIDRYTAAHPWAQFGDNICLGLAADMPITDREQQFIPENLMQDFHDATIARDGRESGLVTRENILLRHTDARQETADVITPRLVFALLLLLTVLLTWAEATKKIRLPWFDVCLFSVISIAGIMICILFVSKHPTTSTNLQILILNPVPFFFLRKIIRRRATRFWKYELAAVILFLIGSFFQKYAEGMHLLALCLLTRCVYNMSDGKLIKLATRQ
ncbi:MAG: DUF4105 domain-containing protein [Prevotella sp.]